LKINLRFKLLVEDWKYRVVNSKKLELAKIKYNSLSERRKHFDGLFWQIPALSLGGQAFLLSIALNNSSRTTARTLSALLGIFIAFVSLASLSRLRNYEFTIADMLKKAEVDLFGYRFSDVDSSEWKEANKRVAKRAAEMPYQAGDIKSLSVRAKIMHKIMHKLYSRLHRFQSYRIWVLTQILFILVGIFIIGNSFLSDDLFTKS
jgi:hypothetical protein